MTTENTDADDGATDDQLADLKQRLAGLERSMARQRERLAAIAEEQTEPAVTRRGVLTTGGLLALLGLGTGTASAGTGQIGTSSSPLDTLYTDELNGGVTGGTALTSLTGSGLTIDGSGNLTTSGGSTSELKTSGNTAFQVVDGGSDVSNANSSIDPPNVVGGHPDNNTGSSSPKGAFIGGGGRPFTPNLASANYATVGGGINNTASGERATVDGGFANTASGHSATVGGGVNNTASGQEATVGGGSDNTASGTEATVGGGDNNTASGTEATVGGGFKNTVSGKQATVPGGREGAAEDDNAFVWNDGTAYHGIPNSAGDGLSSSTAVNGEGVTGSNTFSVSATSGFRFITGSSSVTYIDSSGNLVSAGNVDLDGNKLTNTQSINGGVTGNTEITDLVGSGLTINSGSLETSGGSSTSKLETSGNTAFQVVDSGSDVHNANSTINAPNVVGGHPNNNTGGNSPWGATISGGGRQSSPNSASGYWATVGGGSGNTASDSDATVAGGGGNTASDSKATVGGGSGNTASGTSATVGGGGSNTASMSNATVGGGSGNTASGRFATVGGGFDNTASGERATVPGGANGAATNNNSFVWNDNTTYHTIPNGGDGLNSNTDVNSEPVTGSNTFSVSATGGVRFITGSSQVVYTTDASAGWSTTSTRTAKTNIDPVDPGEILAGVEDMTVSTWEYRDDDGDGTGVRHMGPTAEQFHDAFELGDSEQHINSMNLDGVALAAIQGLSDELDAKDDRIDALEAENEDLREKNDHLRERIAAIEAELGIDATTDQRGVADD